jgi:hypothetical protein
VSESEPDAVAESVSESVSESAPAPEEGSVSEQRQDQQSAAAAVAVTVPVAETVTEEPSALLSPEPTAAPTPEPTPVSTPTPALEPTVLPPDAVVVAEDEIPESEYGRGSGELTVAVTLNGRPVQGLTVDEIEVRAGRDTLELTRVDGPEVAPLMLGIAVDLSPQSASDLPWISRMLTNMAGGAEDGRGMIFVRNRDGSGSDWGHAPSKLSGVIDVVEGGADLSSLVEDALGRFTRIRGRAFLVVVTDGRNTRPGWKETIQNAKRAGVPILIAGIWHQDFGSGARKDLRKLADSSNGSVFYVQGPAQADDLVERFGAAVDGSYSVGVVAAPGTPGVTVSLSMKEADVHASTAVR